MSGPFRVARYVTAHQTERWGIGSANQRHPEMGSFDTEVAAYVQVASLNTAYLMGEVAAMRRIREALGIKDTRL